MKITKHRPLFRNTPVLLTLAFLQFNFHALCQQTVLSWGGDAIGESGSISYSLGQVADEHYTSENGYCNEGVQQPFIPDTVTATFEVTSDLDFSISPNPFRQEVILYTNDALEFDIQYSIMDLTGRHQSSGTIHTTPHSIHLPDWPDGMYIMILRRDQLYIDAIKLIKAK